MMSSIYRQGIASLPRRFRKGGSVFGDYGPGPGNARLAEADRLREELANIDNYIEPGYWDRNENLRGQRQKRIEFLNQQIADAERAAAAEKAAAAAASSGPTLDETYDEQMASAQGNRVYQLAREYRDEASQALKDAGLSFFERGTLLGTLDSMANAQGYVPDYRSIAMSSDPVAAARQASRQLIEAGAYEQAPGVRSVSSLTTRAPVGESEDLLRLVSNLSSERVGPTAELIGATPSGTMLGNMGATAEQIRNRLLNFGQGLSQEQIDALKQQMVDQYGEQITSGFGPGGGIYSALSELTPFDAPVSDADQSYFLTYDPTYMAPESLVDQSVVTASESLMPQTQPAPQPVQQQPVMPAFQDATTFAQGPYQQPAALNQYMQDYSYESMPNAISDYYSQLYLSPYFSYYGTPYMFENVFNQGVYNPQGSNQ